jgi:hypothetical protein
MTSPAAIVEAQLTAAAGPPVFLGDPPRTEKPKGRLETVSNANRTSDYPVSPEAQAALYEQALLADGARRMTEEDRRLAEEGTAAGHDSLPPA